MFKKVKEKLSILSKGMEDIRKIQINLLEMKIINEYFPRCYAGSITWEIFFGVLCRKGDPVERHPHED